MHPGQAQGFWGFPSGGPLVIGDVLLVNGVNVVTLSHPLRVKPRIVRPFLYNITAELGYSAGDEVWNFVGLNTPGGVTETAPAQISPTITQLTVLLMGGACVCHKTTGVLTGITEAKWRMRVFIEA